MSLKIATWNINSVRLRAGLVERFLAEERPDVLCLQETKCPNDAFPRKTFEKAGYGHMAINGQKGYHGVATISRVPFISSFDREFCDAGDTRHISVDVEGAAGKPVRIHNFYVPAGGDDPDPGANPKFAHKLDFLEEMRAWPDDNPSGLGHGGDAVLVGDLNIAPLEDDVWSHKQLLRVVSHTPVETESLERVRTAGDWHDVVRTHRPPPEKLYTWWSYRSRDWRAANKGRRLDHVWMSSGLSGQCTGVSILDVARGWEKSSDHVPVIAEIG